MFELTESIRFGLGSLHPLCGRTQHVTSTEAAVFQNGFQGMDTSSLHYLGCGMGRLHPSVSALDFGLALHSKESLSLPVRRWRGDVTRLGVEP
jgi:hypothetical protein